MDSRTKSFIFSKMNMQPIESVEIIYDKLIKWLQQCALELYYIIKVPKITK